MYLPGLKRCHALWQQNFVHTRAPLKRSSWNHSSRRAVAFAAAAAVAFSAAPAAAAVAFATAPAAAAVAFSAAVVFSAAVPLAVAFPASPWCPWCSGGVSRPVWKREAGVWGRQFGAGGNQSGCKALQGLAATRQPRLCPQAGAPWQGGVRVRVAASLAPCRSDSAALLPAGMGRRRDRCRPQGPAKGGTGGVPGGAALARCPPAPGRRCSPSGR